VPVLQEHFPLAQQAFVLALLAQQVVDGQHNAAFPVPQHFEGLGQFCGVHAAASAGVAVATPITAAASAPPRSRKVFRRAIGAASIFARSSIKRSMDPASTEFRGEYHDTPVRVCRKNSVSDRLCLKLDTFFWPNSCDLFVAAVSSAHGSAVPPPASLSAEALCPCR
jgi:hypothetical protein